MSGLDNLPKAKWVAVGEQPVLKSDLVDIETGILQAWELRDPPRLVWVDATRVEVKATADCPAHVMMVGFPNVLNPGSFVKASLTDGKYRQNAADVYMDFDTASTFWGNEKVSQWYIVFGIAGDLDADFTLKAMPIMRVSSQAVKTITLRNNLNSADIGYGFTTDEFIDSKIYMLSGASKGLVRTITANNNDNGTGGTITYTGDALAVSQGDWFVILPLTNFRWIGSFFNNSAGDIVKFHKFASQVNFEATVSLTVGSGDTEDVKSACPLAVKLRVLGAVSAGGNTSIAAAGSAGAGYLTLYNVGAISGPLEAPLVLPCKYYSASDGGSFNTVGYDYPPGCGY